MLRLGIQVSLKEDASVSKVSRQETHDVICDFVDGFAFGEAIGIGIRSVDSWWTLESVTATSATSKVRLISNLQLQYLKVTR